MKIENKKFIESEDWDELVEETYGRIYKFQQQQGCQDRGIVNITIPDTAYNDEMHDSIPEIVNGEEMGVKFDVWLARDPKQLLLNKEDQQSWSLGMWWERNFYPDLQTIANDLHKKGLIEAGEYVINIDW